MSVLIRLLELISFKLPNCILLNMTKLAGQRQPEIWNKLHVKKLKIYKILPDGNKINLLWDDFYVDCDIYVESIFDRFFVPKLNDVIVDAGAHIGTYTVKTAKIVGSKGCLIAVEPDEENYDLLTKNIRINKFQNIIPVKVALSDFKGTTNFFKSSKSRSHSLSDTLWADSIVDITKTKVTTLDHLLEKLGVTKVDILKINVEGSELNLLRGSENFLTKRKILKIIATPHPPFIQESNKIRIFLERFGYKIKTTDDYKLLYAYI